MVICDSDRSVEPFGSISERKKQSEISGRDLQAENQCETIKKLNSVQDLN